MIDKIGKLNNMIATVIKDRKVTGKCDIEKPHTGKELIAFAKRTLRDCSINPCSKNGDALVNLAIKAFLMTENDQA